MSNIQNKQMDCRVGCGACCIAISISSPIPGMSQGKPAGVRCIHLTTDHKCQLYGDPRKPQVCINLKPSVEMCGKDFAEAYAYLTFLEKATRPDQA